jgi:exodeoxyribonuclease VII large subunit
MLQRPVLSSEPVRPRVGGSAENPCTVSALVASSDKALRAAAGTLWVRGEVSGWKQYASGHCYFTLKDDKSEISCVLWSEAARALPALPENGMEVCVFGQVGIYAKKGQFQFTVQRLATTGMEGLWQLAYDRLVRQLRQEGLLDEGRKRPLPPVPDRIGIVTSAQSAALHDMHRALRRKAWWVTAIVSHCSVEGAGAAPEIAAALRRFGTGPGQTPVDVVIVARGGGSKESLWAYNLEEVARAIADCPFPVISAVGHETDHSVADLVADVRAATPTAGAERAVPEGRDIMAALDDFPRASSIPVRRLLARHADRVAHTERELRLAGTRRVELLSTRVDGAEAYLEARSPRRVLQAAAQQVERADADLRASLLRRVDGVRAAVDAAAEGLAARHPGHAVARAAESVERLERELGAGLQRRVDALGRELAAAAEALEARSPLKVLARGYALLSDDATGRVVRAPEDAAPGQRLRVRLARGELVVQVVE